MEYRILFDFGSTFTKAAVICKEEKAVVFTTRHPSTVKEDARIAMKACLSDIRRAIGGSAADRAETVSYTHLDVYKRQALECFPGLFYFLRSVFAG